MSILSGYKKIKKYIKTTEGYKLISQWTNSNTVEMDNGKTLEINLGSVNGITDSLTATSSNIALSAAGGNNLQGQIDTLNSSLIDIGKTCCFRQSNTSKVSNGYCPVDVQEYNDDTNLYKADSSGVLITKPGTYLVVAHFHINFNENDGVKLSIKNSIKELLVSNHYDYNANNTKQLQVTLSTIVRFTTGQERVLLNIESTNGASYIYDWTLTNINRIAITKIK